MGNLDSKHQAASIASNHCIGDNHGKHRHQAEEASIRASSWWGINKNIFENQRKQDEMHFTRRLKRG